MKIRTAIGCLTLLLAFGPRTWAQLVAGSPEDQLFMRISAAADPDQKLALIQQFERDYPEAPASVFVSLFTMSMRIYAERNEAAGILESGEKILARDPENVDALMTVARTLAVQRQDLPKALDYAQRAVSAAEGMRTKEPPASYTEQEWSQYVESTEDYARGILSYVRSVSP